MRKRWVHLGYVQTQLPLSREERLEVEKRANKIAGRRKFFIVKVSIVSVVLLGGFVGAGPVVAVWLWRQTGMPIMLAILGAIAFAAIGIVTYIWLVWRWYTKPMRIALNELGYSVCVRCGYWLRDLPNDVAQCPECGKAMVKNKSMQ